MIRRWQRELGAPLDDTKEIPLAGRAERRTPLTDDLILSLFREQKKQIDALTAQVAALEAARDPLCECGCSFAAHDCLSDDMECLRCACESYRPRRIV